LMCQKSHRLPSKRTGKEDAKRGEQSTSHMGYRGATAFLARGGGEAIMGWKPA